MEECQYSKDYNKNYNLNHTMCKVFKKYSKLTQHTKVKKFCHIPRKDNRTGKTAPPLKAGSQLKVQEDNKYTVLPKKNQVVKL